METELLSTAAAIGHQHLAKSPEGTAGPAVNNKTGIIKEFASLFLDLIHEGVLLVRVKRLIKTAQPEKCLPARHHVAKDEFFLGSGSEAANRSITGTAGTKRDPAGHCPGKDLLQGRSLRRTKIRAANDLDDRIFEKFSPAAKSVLPRKGIVIQKINEFTRGLTQSHIALDGRLLPAHDQNLQKLRGIIHPPRGFGSRNLGISRSSRDNDRDCWQLFLHV